MWSMKQEDGRKSKIYQQVIFIPLRSSYFMILPLLSLSSFLLPHYFLSASLVSSYPRLFACSVLTSAPTL